MPDTVLFDGLDIRFKPIHIDAVRIRLPVVDRNDTRKSATNRRIPTGKKDDGMIRQSIRMSSEINSGIQYPEKPPENPTETLENAAMVDPVDSFFK